MDVLLERGGDRQIVDVERLKTEIGPVVRRQRAQREEPRAAEVALQICDGRKIELDRPWRGELGYAKQHERIEREECREQSDPHVRGA